MGSAGGSHEVADRHGLEKIKTIGHRKLGYDVWGDTVNMASRAEAHGLPASIQVTHHVHERLCGRYELRDRGLIELKGSGPTRTSLLLGRR